MNRKLSLATVLLALWTLALAVIVVAIPAQAHHKDDHPVAPATAGGDRDGDADSDPGTAYDEDDDADGQPNVPDPAGDADNRHPSGKNRSAEAGASGVQGRSESDPDDDGRRPDRCAGRAGDSDACGTDKPNGEDGVDELDQDGNNGCGSDDDFDGDNEGRCAGPAAAGNVLPGEVRPGGETRPGGQMGSAGQGASRPAGRAAADRRQPRSPVVLGRRLERA